jgi:predicted nucleic-acid-binding protein
MEYKSRERIVVATILRDVQSIVNLSDFNRRAINIGIDG